MKKKILSQCALTALCYLSVTNAQQASFVVDVDLPEHGSVIFEPRLPSDGRLASGSQLLIKAIPDSGYQVDTLYAAVPGVFGSQYLESMGNELTLVVDQDMTVSALYLPDGEFDGFTTRQDIVYAQPGVKVLDYDVWAPDSAQNLPIVVIIHGGGWRANTEDIMRGMAREIVRSKRYLVISMDYRWVGTADGDEYPNSMKDLINDVFGAIAHIQEHAAEYGGDPNRIAVTGDSAGGHLSAVAANMPNLIGDGGFGESEGVFEFLPSYIPAGKQLAELREEITAAIQAVAPSYGVFSSDSYGGRAGLNHFSTDPRADQSWAEAISPIFHVPDASVRSIPHYLTRGTADGLISDTMVTEYVKVLGEKNQRVRYDQVPDAGHAFFDWKPDQRTRDTFVRFGVPYIGELVKFFDSVFYPTSN